MILGIDYGDRHIGLAASDEDDKLPYRYDTIDVMESDVLDYICEIVEREDVTLIVVGIPTSLNGTKSEQTELVEEFVEELEHLLPDIEIDTEDETMTSSEASRIIKQEGGKQQDIHAEAARLILETYLTY